MKKHFNTTIVILLGIFTISSCQDFLTKSPETSLSPESFFKTAGECELWTNKFYDDILPTAEELAELAADDHFANGLNAVQKGTRTPSSKSWSTSTWKPLRNINHVCPVKVPDGLYKV